MEISRKKLVTLVLVWALFGFVSGYLIQNYALHPVSRTKAGANVFVTVETTMGVHEIPIHNVITNTGEQQVATRMRVGGSYAACDYISIGNATASASLDQLTVEYARAQGTVSSLWTYNGDAAFNVTKKFTFTETVTLNACGGHWASTGSGNMYACANFDQTTFQANWNLTITWVYVFDGN